MRVFFFSFPISHVLGAERKREEKKALVPVHVGVDENNTAGHVHMQACGVCVVSWCHFHFSVLLNINWIRLAIPLSNSGFESRLSF